MLFASVHAGDTVAVYTLGVDLSSAPLLDGVTFALGLITGVLSGAFGVGGAVVSTPGLRLLGVPALVAVGTTLPSILPVPRSAPPAMSASHWSTGESSPSPHRPG